jgi:hypothetical protein
MAAGQGARAPGRALAEGWAPYFLLNVEMPFVGVLLGVAVLAGLAVWAFRRRGSDEMHSVAGYQHRLERLEEVRRRQGGSVRIVGGTTPNPGTPSQPVIGEDGRIEISSSASRRRPLDDAGELPRSGNRLPPPTYRRPRDVSIARMSHRPRRLGAPIAAAAIVIVLVTGLAIAGAHSRTPRTTTSTTTGHKSNTRTTQSTTTTVPKPTTFTATSTNSEGGTYALPFPSYAVTFKATTGDCYIQITNAQGKVPYAQVLDAGATEQMVLTGNSEVILGAPSSITVQVDRTPVTFPTPLPAPLHLNFEASSPPSTTTTT